MHLFNNGTRESGFVREIEHILAPYFVRTHFKARHLLWHEGEPGSKMVSIKKGKVKIFRALPDGRQASIYIFGPGETFGFLPFIDGSPYPASAEILEDTDALVMTQDKLHEAMKKDPEVAVFLLGHLAKRLRGAFDQIERLSIRGVLPRVAAALLSLTVRPGEREDLKIVTLPVSSREYAALIGLTPESFSRGITRLADMDIIHRLKGNAFQILAPDRLQKESRAEI